MYFNTYLFTLQSLLPLIEVRMTDYNFLADLLDTFQSSPDWIKALWLLTPPGFLLGLIAMAMRFHIANKQMDHGSKSELIYSVHRNAGISCMWPDIFHLSMATRHYS